MGANWLSAVCSMLLSGPSVYLRYIQGGWSEYAFIIILLGGKGLTVIQYYCGLLIIEGNATNNYLCILKRII